MPTILSPCAKRTKRTLCGAAALTSARCPRHEPAGRLRTPTEAAALRVVRAVRQRTPTHKRSAQRAAEHEAERPGGGGGEHDARRRRPACRSLAERRAE